MVLSQLLASHNILHAPHSICPGDINPGNMVFSHVGMSGESSQIFSTTLSNGVV